MPTVLENPNVKSCKNFEFLFFAEKLFLQKSFDEFPNQSMGKTEIDGVDDREEMEITDVIMIIDNYQ